jgi:hypothetical protein
MRARAWAYRDGNTSGNVNRAVVESSLFVSLCKLPGHISSRMEDVIDS